jgi:lambda family phage tail tape measure protein
VAPNLDEIKKAMEERKKLEEDYQKRQLKLLNERADALALFYGDDAEMAKIVGDEDIKRGEIAIKLMKERILYAEDLRGTMDALGVADPEMDLAEGMANIGNIVKEVSPQVQRMMDEWYQKTQAVANLYATVFRGEDGVIADMANTAISAFHGMTDALTDFVMTGKKNFTNFANSVIADIMRIAIRQSVVGPLAQGLMGVFAPASPYGGGFASGGPVSGGVSYLVGERGPELFTPSSSGNITPNGGSGNVTVNIKNESGQPVKARASSSFDLSGTVIDIVLDGLNRNVHGLRTALGGA